MRSFGWCNDLLLVRCTSSQDARAGITVYVPCRAKRQTSHPQSIYILTPGKAAQGTIRTTKPQRAEPWLPELACVCHSTHRTDPCTRPDGRCADKGFLRPTRWRGHSRACHLAGFGKGSLHKLLGPPRGNLARRLGGPARAHGLVLHSSLGRPSSAPLLPLLGPHGPQPIGSGLAKSWRPGAALGPAWRASGGGMQLCVLGHLGLGRQLARKLRHRQLSAPVRLEQCACALLQACCWLCSAPLVQGIPCLLAAQANACSAQEAWQSRRPDCGAPPGRMAGACTAAPGCQSSPGIQSGSASWP